MGESLAIADKTFTFTGAGSPTGGPLVYYDTRRTGLVTALSTSTGSSVISPTATPAASAGESTGLNKNVQRILIAAGSAVVFVTILFLFYIFFRVRRRTTGGFLGFFKRKDVPERYPPLKGLGDWDFKDADTDDGQKFPPPTSRSGSLPTISPRTPHSATLPFVPPPAMEHHVPPPLKLQPSTFIGREGNQLVRASLNRHQLSTLDEQSSYNAEADALPSFPRKAAANPVHHGPGLAQQISASATARRTSDDPHKSFDSISSGFGDGTLPPPLASPHLPPIQPAKPQNRQTSRSSWMTEFMPLNSQSAVIDPRTSTATSVDTLPRFRSVNGWVDYQTSRAAAEQKRNGSPPVPTDHLNYHQPGEEIRLAIVTEDLPSSGRGSITITPISREGSKSRGGSPPRKGSPPTYGNSGGGAGVRRMDSASTATVFRAHPGDEVRIDRNSVVRSDVLDQYLNRY
ncbi:MAG: hypothetical protein M1833_007037 [Piccolia ochrophora]|nr:MAG: hypothetical protein M1833_007037 [Piccolia ochrophora]